MFIQRPVDLGEEWTPSDVVCCQSVRVFMHVCVCGLLCVCVGRVRRVKRASTSRGQELWVRRKKGLSDF